MGDIYGSLAPLYDAVNAEIDYEEWADAVERGFREYASRPVRVVLDIGCGTGSMTIPLAKRGYEMIGLDLSDEMLNVALARAEEAGVADKILWVMQDMTKIELYDRVDAVVCTLDGLNHLPGRDALLACFSCVEKYLAPGGVFLFDLNSLYKFERVYGNEVYTMETEGAFCVWQNDYHPSGKFCDFWVTLFQKQSDGRYDRHDSVQREHYFSLRTVRQALKESGLTFCHAYGNLEKKDIVQDDERWYIAAVKGM